MTRCPPSVRRSVAGGPCALLAFLVAIPVGAAELVVGATSEYAYTSNFFASPSNPDLANSFLIGPTVALSHDHGRLSTDLGFTGTYQAYVDQDGVNAWESRLRSRTSYELDSKTTLRVTDRFRDVTNLRFSRQDIELADTALDPNLNRYFRNVLDVELLRDLTRRLSLNLRGTHSWTDFRKNVDRNDSQAFEGASSLRYQLADRHSIGIGTSYVHQDFQEALSRLGSTSDSITTLLSWNWNLFDNVVFIASGGPAWIRSEYDDVSGVSQSEFVGGRRNGDLFRANIATCDFDPRVGSPIASRCDLTNAPIPAGDLGPIQTFALDPGQEIGAESVVTGFGSTSLQANLTDWNLQATYSRQQNTTSGGGLVSSLDRFYLEAELAPVNLRWSVFVAGSWDRRETLTRATVVDFLVEDDGNDAARRTLAFTRNDQRSERLESFTAITGLRSAFTRNQSATVEFRYRRSESRSQGVEQPGADSYFVVVSLAYTLDPIRF